MTTQTARDIYEHYNNKMDARFRFLYRLWYDFAEKQSKRYDGFGNETLVSMNPKLLWNVVYTYYLRLDIYKQIHSTKTAGPPKRAALTAIWISKLRPVCLLNGQDHEDIRAVHLLANERFAIHVAFAMLKVDIGGFPMHRQKELINRLMYSLRYGQPSEDELILAFQYISALANPGIFASTPDAPDDDKE